MSNPHAVYLKLFPVCKQSNWLEQLSQGTSGPVQASCRTQRTLMVKYTLRTETSFVLYFVNK